MKTAKNYFILIGFTITTILYSQMATYDAKADVNSQLELAKMTEQIKEAASQTEKLSKMKSSIDKNLKWLEEVNQNIQNIDQMREVVRQQKEIYDLAFSIKKEFKDSDLNIKLFAENSTNKTLESLKSSISLLNKVLSNSYFKMNDAERLNIIENEDKKTNEMMEQLVTNWVILKNYNSAVRKYNQIENH